MQPLIPVNLEYAQTVVNIGGLIVFVFIAGGVAWAFISHKKVQQELEKIEKEGGGTSLQG